MLIALYLIAIITANLLIVQFGPSVTMINAFLFIGLDLTTRDYLHDRWQGKKLWLKMLALIGAGSLLSYSLNANAGPIAMASFVAFAVAGIADTVAYWLLGDRAKLVRINGSNIISAAVDSLIFPILAFGFPILWWVILGQFAAKTIGGFIWALVLRRFFNRPIEPVVV
jgi:hypothetical protein